MPDEQKTQDALTCTLAFVGTTTVLRLAGPIGSAPPGFLRDALVVFAADQTPPLEIDVSALIVKDPATLTVFTEFAREVAYWPCGLPALRLIDSQREDWSTTNLPVVNDRASTPFGAASQDVLAVNLAPDVGAARLGRDLVTEACAMWNIATAAGAACIVASELISNVVSHASTAMTLHLGRHPTSLRLAVRDRSTLLPIHTGPAPANAPRGRGLMLIDALARRWGTTALPNGKIVWAVMDAGAEQDVDGAGPPERG